MNDTTNYEPFAGRRPDEPAGASETRPLYWSIRRELWENRFLYIVPLIVASFVFFGFVVSTIGMPHRRRATLLLSEAQQQAKIAMPYDVAATVLIVVTMIIGFFYCLDALHGERRDRSILFWKSLPVSDLTTVLSKAFVPLLVLPSIAFVFAVITQWMMLLWSTVVLLPSGLAGTTWSRFNIFTQSVILLYGLIALVLWHAPIYAWLLLVSAWARRATVLWAILPWLLIGILEHIIFNTKYFPLFLKSRLMGHIGRAFDFPKNGRLYSLDQLTPGRFAATPGLWLGLIVAALLFAAAVRMRRYREPI